MEGRIDDNSDRWETYNLNLMTTCYLFSTW